MKNLLRCFAWAVAIAVVFAICTPMASAQSACPSGTSPFYWLRTNADTQVPAFCFDPTNGNVNIPNITPAISAFSGGAVASPILEPNGTCPLPAYGYSTLAGTGNYIATSSGLGFCYNGTELIRIGTNVRFGPAAFGGGTVFTGNDAEYIRLAAGLFGLRESGTVLAKYGGMTNCSGAAVDIGVFCWDKTLEKWRFSENNSGFNDAFGPVELNGYCTGTATASATLGMSPGMGSQATNTCVGTYTAASERMMASAGTFTKLYIKCQTGGVNASSGVFTVMKNNTAQTITATVGVGTTANDTAHSFSYVAGDTIGLRFTTQAAETLATCTASIS
jgi:hypothetical protein